MTDEKIKTNGKIQRKLVTKNIWDCRPTVGQTLIFGPYHDTYRNFASSNTSPLEAHVGFFRLLMKGFFGPYVLRPFDKKLIFQFVTYTH